MSTSNIEYQNWTTNFVVDGTPYFMKSHWKHPEIDVEWRYESWASCPPVMNNDRLRSHWDINQNWKMIDLAKAVQSWVGKYKTKFIKVKQEYWNENWIDFIDWKKVKWNIYLKVNVNWLYKSQAEKMSLQGHRKFCDKWIIAGVYKYRCLQNRPNIEN